MQEFEADPVWLNRLARMNAVIVETRQPLVGNLLYDHLQPDYALSPPNPILRPKRERFRRAVTGRACLLEIGVNGGHSAFLALTSNATLEFHGVDICEHAYVKPVVDWLKLEFPGRVFLHEGDCRDVLPRIARSGLRFDVFHVDGAKFTYFQDIRNCQMMALGDAIAIIDDVQLDEVATTFTRCIREGRVGVLDDYPSMPAGLTYRNEIVRLMPSTWSQTLAFRATSPIRHLVRAEYVQRFNCAVSRQVRRTTAFGRHPIETTRRRLRRLMSRGRGVD